MTEAKKLSGACLCGTVSLSAEPANFNVGACHCGTCRKWGGGPLMTIDCGTGIAISGEQNVAIFDSSEWADRGFCKTCGTHLFYRLKGNQQYIVPAGLFDLASKANFDHQVFIDQKPEFYSFSNETKNMTGAELFAMFTADNE